MADLAEWLYSVTQAFGVNSERGTDYGTPFGTPLIAPYGGVVTRAGYYPWGGEVDIATSVPGHPEIKSETLLHLDQLFVKVGDQVPQFGKVGLSGGQLQGGSHPAQPQYSGGPHTEIDFWKGMPWASPSVNPDPILQGLGGVGSGSADPLGFNPFDPAALAGVVGGDAASAYAAAVKAAGSAGSATSQVGPGLLGIAEAIQGIPASIGHGLANALAIGGQDVGIFMKRQIVALAVAAVVLLILFA